MTAAELVEAVKTADVLVPTVTDRIDSRVLSQAGPRLKLIASFGTGVDHIDLDTARQRGITVTNTPGVLTEDTADMTMALILAVPRRMGEGRAPGARRQVDRLEPDRDAGPPHLGKRLGIVGMGRIGQALARRARGFGLSIHYHNRKRVHPEIESELEATYWESLDQMLARMDIVSVNCPHTPATFHLLSARRLKLMKPTAYHRQHRARRGDRRERAGPHARTRASSPAPGLDVFEHEPQVNPKLLELDSVVLLPHMGSATLEGRIEMGEKVHHQHQDLRRRPQAAGPRPGDDVLGAFPRAGGRQRIHEAREPAPCRKDDSSAPSHALPDREPPARS